MKGYYKKAHEWEVKAMKVESLSYYIMNIPMIMIKLTFR